MVCPDPGAGGVRRDPGHCAVADRYILLFGAGVNFDSFQSLGAMGLFQLVFGFDFYGGGEG